MTYVILLLAGAASAAAPADSVRTRLQAGLSGFGYEQRQTLLIELRRSDCDRSAGYDFSRCPEYELRLHGDGAVLYQGWRNVAVSGPQSAAVSDEAVKKAVKAFLDAGFLDFEDRYESAPEGETRVHGDVVAHTRPWATLTLRLGSDVKTVRHYSGDAAAPKALTELEKAFDALLDVKRWTEPSAAKPAP
jgi:hypothetical protein